MRAHLLILLAVAIIIAVRWNNAPIAIAEGPLSISGTVWDDQNADGVRQPSEPGMPNMIVEAGLTVAGETRFVDANGRPLFDDGAGHFVRTDDNGNYTFRNLAPGSYVVRLSAGTSNFRYLTRPIHKGSGEYNIAVTLTDRSLNGLDFGLNSPTGVLVVHGIAWANADIADTRSLRAFIDGVDCTAPGGILPTDQLPGTFLLGVAPVSLVPGCGAPGKVVRFTVEGLPANETVIWPGDVVPAAPDRGRRPTRIEMDLTAGPPFAYFVGILTTADRRQIGFDTADFRVLVNGNDCGRIGGGVFLAALVVIRSAEMAPGCGYEGATVSFTYRGLPVGPTVAWHAGNLHIDEIVLPASLQAGGLRPPVVGEVGLK